MFGSKIRSWMENHIVRPRKKGNKNKNNGISATVQPQLQQNGYKGNATAATATEFPIYQGDGTTTTTSIATVTVYGNQNVCSSNLSSPAKRHEVSPIQSHTTSRFGWQSPNQETAMSPKSDHFMYIQHNSVKAHPHSSTSPTTFTSSRVGNPIAKSTKHSLAGKKVFQPIATQQQNLSSSSSSLSWSTGSHKNQSNNTTTNSSKRPKPPSPRRMFSSSISNGAAPALVAPRAQTADATSAVVSNRKYSTPMYQPQCTSNNKFNLTLDSEANDVHYEEIGACTQNSKHNRCQTQQPRSLYQAHEYASHLQNVASSCESNKFDDDPTARYGKLLPSKIQQDRLNANHVSSSIFEENCRTMNTNNNNNNNHLSETSESTGNGFFGKTIAATYETHVQVVPPIVGYPSRNNLLRGSYCNGGSGAVTGPPAHIINSLSSPESAYSTGYSTDGTSPGATYIPPEYYINMRTGTHYFPKSINTLAIEAQRYKFGLNKIEEMSPQDPLPNNSALLSSLTGMYRRTDNDHNKIHDYGMPDPKFCQNQVQTQHQQHPQPIGTESPIPLQNIIVIPTLKGFVSPSPRQRSRIRTNPWYATTDTSSSRSTIATTTQAYIFSSSSQSSTQAKNVADLDAASSSSSGIKTSSDNRGPSDKKNCKSTDESSETSSSTEVEVENLQRTYSPNTIRRKKSEIACHSPELTVAAAAVPQNAHIVGQSLHQDVASDEDATLNEMMGKFDESYVYEKETDILSSDSDPTDCPSDLDTGQDAGDECDTDDMLDIDFIDTSSIQEFIVDRRNTSSNLENYSKFCSNYPHQQLEERQAIRVRRAPHYTHRSVHEMTDAVIGCYSQRRRKRLLKTRKKSESKGQCSPMRNSRQSRSLGGTPECLRRHQLADVRKQCKTPTLTNRSSSLTFTEVHAIRGRFITIAESEKALLRADLEADVKYRQLIHEAETILVSMKTSAPSIIAHDTPVASPRRVCNPLANKRVEMLKCCEADIKRELLKQQQQQHQRRVDAATTDIENAAAVNKRVEMLKYETNSAPNSPKSSRFSPRKTHITNFINQNAPSEVPKRAPQTPQSPKFQLNGRQLNTASLTSSPIVRRRYRSQSPKKAHIYSDSDSSDDNDVDSNDNHRASRECHCNFPHRSPGGADDGSNRNCLPEIEKITLYDESDYSNRNAIDDYADESSLMTFKSIGGGSVTNYCPQSEPLKRKVYKGSSSFERIKKSLDLESEISKQSVLEKINNLRYGRQNYADESSVMQDLRHLFDNNIGEEHFRDDDTSISSNLSAKQQLILNTIEDLKRSLQHQSVELYGLNGKEQT